MLAQNDRPKAAPGFPAYQQSLPPDLPCRGPFGVRFARSVADLHELQRLRFDVFNRELGEGLERSRAIERDEDEFDPFCHHLLVYLASTGEAVGTYRLQTRQMAERGCGFYAATEFDLSAWPEEVLDQSVEIGRACVARGHRGLRVLYLLWSGLAHYLVFNGKRYLFGCTSLTSQDPAEGLSVFAYLHREGHVHPSLAVTPLPGLACETEPGVSLNDPRPLVPRLMRAYLSLGARICGPPAIDRLFKTIDYLSFFDADTMDQRAMNYFGYRSASSTPTPS